MDRNRRFEVMAAVDPQPLLELAEAVLAGTEVSIVTPPRVGTLLLRLREPVDGKLFNAGELLVTEAQVGIGPHLGYAMRLGRAPEATLAAAVLDAAVEANHPLTPYVLAQLECLLEAETARQRAAWQAVAPTRVSFDEMA